MLIKIKYEKIENVDKVVFLTCAIIGKQIISQ